VNSNIPDKVVCVIEESGKPLEGLLIIADFNTIKKNNYSILIGPTNKNGTAMKTKKEILASAKEEKNLFFMDYVELENNFSGTIDFTILRKASLLNLLKAYKAFNKYVSYPKDLDKIVSKTIENISNISFNKIKMKCFAKNCKINILDDKTLLNNNIHESSLKCPFKIGDKVKIRENSILLDSCFTRKLNNIEKPFIIKGKKGNFLIFENSNVHYNWKEFVLDE